MGKKGGDLTKTERIHSLRDYLMAGRTVTPRWYEHKYHMSRKSLGRDLDELSAMGIAIVEERTPEGMRYTVDASSRSIMVPHSLNNVIALFLGRRMFDFLDGTTLEKDFAEVYTYIEKRLSKKQDIDNRQKLAQKLYMIHEGPKHFTQKTSVHLDTLLRALRYEMALEVTYRSMKNEPHEIRMYPLTLVTFRRGLYLIAKVPDWDNVIGRFAIERFDSVLLTGERFTYPDDYSPEGFFSSALFMDTGPCQKVRLRFAPGAEAVIGLRQFHPSQKTVKKKDGYVEMTMTVHDGYELVHWLLSFGRFVEVLQPESLRKSVMDTLKQTLRQYTKR